MIEWRSLGDSSITFAMQRCTSSAFCPAWNSRRTVAAAWAHRMKPVQHIKSYDHSLIVRRTPISPVHQAVILHWCLCSRSMRVRALVDACVTGQHDHGTAALNGDHDCTLQLVLYNEEPHHALKFNL